MLRNYRWVLPAAVMVGLLGGIGLARHDDNEARRTVEGSKRSANSLKSKSDTIKVQKGDLKIVYPNSTVKDLLHYTRIDSVVQVLPTETEAVELLQKQLPS